MVKKAKKQENSKEKTIQRKWYLVDAKDKILGRFATKITDLLRGKNKPSFCYHIDSGNFVVVINADKIKFTGRKLDQKIYYHHSGYLGNLKEEKLKDLFKRRPEEVLRKAVLRMLPKNRLQKRMISRLKIFRDEKHSYNNQNLIKYES